MQTVPWTDRGELVYVMYVRESVPNKVRPYTIARNKISTAATPVNIAHTHYQESVNDDQQQQQQSGMQQQLSKCIPYVQSNSRWALAMADPFLDVK